MRAEHLSVVQPAGLGAFDRRVVAQLPSLLERLLDAPRFPRLEHPRGTIPKRPGVYLFSDHEGHPVYVGQSRNLYNRLAQHTRDSSSHVAASFAFNIAKREALGAGVDITGFREELVARTDLDGHFAAAKRALAGLPVQCALEDDPDLRTVFEVYATYVLGTQSYNNFETH